MVKLHKMGPVRRRVSKMDHVGLRTGGCSIRVADLAPRVDLVSAASRQCGEAGPLRSQR